MARQTTSKKKKPKKPKTDHEFLSMQLLPLLAEVMTGEEGKDELIEATLRAGESKKVDGKLDGTFAKVELDIAVRVNSYHVRDEGGVRRRCTVQLTGPVLKKKKKAKSKAA